MGVSDQYIYCIADVNDTENPHVETTGVDDEPVELLVTDGVGVATHACDGLYDSADEKTITQWLLSHQSVVDAVGDSFGTPVPIRFDTVFEGGPASVEQWVSTHRDRIDDTLERLSGHWEYRITLLWNQEAFTAQVANEDEKLQQLAHRQEAATGGTEYMLERQREQRLRELEQSRRAELAATLADAVDSVVTESTEFDATDIQGRERDEKQDRVTQLAVLAHETVEGKLGNELDEIATIDGVTVRFTGPWPPYAFTPEFE